MSDETNRFLAAYNRVDAAMRKHTRQQDRTIRFSEVAIKFEKSTYFKHGDFIRLVADLRNFLIHEKKGPHEELAIPVESVVARLERIAAELEAPEKVEKRFVHGEIACVSPSESIKDVLHLVAERGYSQFPVIENDKIIGLLTENGITRWLAAEVAKESMIEFVDMTVQTVLSHEESRENMIVIGRLSELNVVRLLFTRNALLEAAIITQTGKPHQKPLGILTRWDLIESPESA